MSFADLSKTLGRREEPGDPESYELLGMLRSSSPVTRVPSPAGEGYVWLVTSYELARACLGDARLSFDPRNAAIPQHAPGHAPYILARDPPVHTTLRGLISGHFSPGRMRLMRPRIREICEDLLGRLAGGQNADLMEDYALPIPETVAYELFGIPEDKRLPPGRATELALVISLREQYAGGAASDELRSYVTGLLEGGHYARSDGIIGSLMKAFEAGDIGYDDVTGMFYLLFSTGQLSTAPFIGCAILRICLNSGWIPGLSDRPARWREILNEALRMDSVVQVSMPRFALQDMEIGGAAIAKGDTVIVSNAAANRDPGRFDAADEFAPLRKARANLAFGYGVHFCVGAPLARLEGEIAVDALFRRFPGLRLAVDPAELTWVLGPMLRAPERLPVLLDGALARQRRLSA